MNQAQQQFTTANPVGHFRCCQCRRHCYGCTEHYFRIAGEGVTCNRFGPYCDDCFKGDLAVKVPVETSSGGLRR